MTFRFDLQWEFEVTTSNSKGNKPAKIFYLYYILLAVVLVKHHHLVEFKKRSYLWSVVVTSNSNPANNSPMCFSMQVTSLERVRSETWRQHWVGLTPPSRWCLSVETMTWATPPHPKQWRTIAKRGVMTISAFGWGIFHVHANFSFISYFASHLNCVFWRMWRMILREGRSWCSDGFVWNLPNIKKWKRPPSIIFKEWNDSYCDTTHLPICLDCIAQ